MMTAQTKSKAVLPTKKQKELLEYIEVFIAEHGYSPSYREIMKGLNYTSVATVALHVGNLIKRGHLVKRDKSARSLEVIKPKIDPGSQVKVKQLQEHEAKWLVGKVELYFKDAEKSGRLTEKDLDPLYVLIGALKVLGLDGAANSYIPRLTAVRDKISKSQYLA